MLWTCLYHYWNQILEDCRMIRRTHCAQCLWGWPCMMVSPVVLRMMRRLLHHWMKLSTLGPSSCLSFSSSPCDLQKKKRRKTITCTSLSILIAFIWGGGDEKCNSMVALTISGKSFGRFQYGKDYSLKVLKKIQDTQCYDAQKIKNTKSKKELG